MKGENTTIANTLPTGCPSRRILGSNISAPEHFLLLLSIFAFALACFTFCFYAFAYPIFAIDYWISADRWRVACDPNTMKVLDDLVFLLSVEVGVLFGVLLLAASAEAILEKYASSNRVRLTHPEVTQPMITPIESDKRVSNRTGPDP